MRVPPARREHLPPEYHDLWDRLADRPGGMPLVYQGLAQNPPVWEAFNRFMRALWEQGGLDLARRELVILRVALIEEAPYPWQQHLGRALAAGLSREQILALGDDWRGSALFAPAERALLAYVDEVASDGNVPAPIVAELASHYPNAAIVGITALIGFYLSVARLTKALEVDTRQPFVGWQLEHLPAR